MDPLATSSCRSTKPSRGRVPHLWYDAMTISGVRYRPPKQMRHTYATLALAAGLPLESISKQLRHTELESTRKHYARLAPLRRPALAERREHARRRRTRWPESALHSQDALPASRLYVESRATSHPRTHRTSSGLVIWESPRSEFDRITPSRASRDRRPVKSD